MEFLLTLTHTLPLLSSSNACSWRRKSKTVPLLTMLPSSKVKLGMMGPLAVSEIQSPGLSTNSLGLLVHHLQRLEYPWSTSSSLSHGTWFVWPSSGTRKNLATKQVLKLPKVCLGDSKTSLKGFILGCSSSFLVERWVSIKFVFNVSSVKPDDKAISIGINFLKVSKEFKRSFALLVQAYLKHLKKVAFQQNLIHWFLVWWDLLCLYVVVEEKSIPIIIIIALFVIGVLAMLLLDGLDQLKKEGFGLLLWYNGVNSNTGGSPIIE